MIEQEFEKKYWEGLQNQKICIQKEGERGRHFYYNGYISQVLDDKLLFIDDRIGKTLLCFKGLSLLIKRGGE